MPSSRSRKRENKKQNTKRKKQEAWVRKAIRHHITLFACLHAPISTHTLKNSTLPNQKHQRPSQSCNPRQPSQILEVITHSSSYPLTRKKITSPQPTLFNGLSLTSLSLISLGLISLSSKHRLVSFPRPRAPPPAFSPLPRSSGEPRRPSPSNGRRVRRRRLVRLLQLRELLLLLHGPRSPQNIVGRLPHVGGDRGPEGHALVGVRVVELERHRVQEGALNIDPVRASPRQAVVCLQVSVLPVADDGVSQPLFVFAQNGEQQRQQQLFIYLFFKCKRSCF